MLHSRDYFRKDDELLEKDFMSKAGISLEEYEKMLETLGKQGHKGLANFTHLFLAGLGAAAGAAGAPALAALAPVIGVAAVVGTPIGWLAGAAAAGGALVYGVGACLKAGGRRKAKQARLDADITEKIECIRAKANFCTEDEIFREIIGILRIGHTQHVISPADGIMIIAGLSNHSLTNSQALDTLETIATRQGKPLEK